MYTNLLCTLILAAITVFGTAVQPTVAAPMCGVIDSEGHWLISPKYSSIEFLGPNLVFISTFEKSGSMGPRGFLADSSGNPLPVVQPEGCSVIRAWPRKSLPLTSSDDCLLVIQGAKGQGIIEPSGKIILPPIYEVVGVGDGYITGAL